ncbi:MAG TPA: DUF202 domain-containing protein [Candidatus Omnitrophota bacterium]|nr:DUF202 domain-containing protein [Candidatus Omnitrophota bacterium]
MEQSPADTKSLADDRTVLANERTYAAWVRTGIAAMVSGLAVERLQADLMPGWAINAISAALVVFSIIAFGVGTLRYHHMSAKLHGVASHPLPVQMMMIVTVLLTLAAAMSLLAIFWFHPWTGQG